MAGASAALLDRLTWAHARRGREWTADDRELYRVIDARSWGFGEANRVRAWTLPSWIGPELVPPRRMGGYGRFVGLLVAAYRAGALGLLLSYDECMALCDVSSRSTWAAWVRDMERRGVVRVVATWKDGAKTSGFRRDAARLHYRVGPELERAAGMALVEGVAEGPAARWAERCAMGARSKAKARRRAAKGRLWAAANGSDRRSAADLPAVHNSKSTPPRSGSETPAPGPEPGGSLRSPANEGFADARASRGSAGLGSETGAAPTPDDETHVSRALAGSDDGRAPRRPGKLRLGPGIAEVSRLRAVPRDHDAERRSAGALELAGDELDEPPNAGTELEALPINAPGEAAEDGPEDRQDRGAPRGPPSEFGEFLRRLVKSEHCDPALRRSSLAWLHGEPPEPPPDD